MEQLNLHDEPGWKASERQSPPDPVLVFVVDGIRLSLQQNQMTREQAIEKVKSWYPNALIQDLLPIMKSEPM